MNRREEYSYKEFVNSLSVNDGGAGDGLWVSRDVRPVMKEQNVLPSSGQFLTWTMKGVLDELARLLNKKPSDQITELAAVFGLSRKDIAIKLRDTFLSPVEKSLEVDRIADEISHWINTTSREDPSFAIELALALRETGVLAIQQGNAGQKVGVIPQNRSSHIDPVISGSNPSEKVANFIGPIFASKASQEIKMQPG